MAMQKMLVAYHAESLMKRRVVAAARPPDEFERLLHPVFQEDESRPFDPILGDGDTYTPGRAGKRTKVAAAARWILILLGGILGAIATDLHSGSLLLWACLSCSGTMQELRLDSHKSISCRNETSCICSSCENQVATFSWS